MLKFAQNCLAHYCKAKIQFVLFSTAYQTLIRSKKIFQKFYKNISDSLTDDEVKKAFRELDEVNAGKIDVMELS